MIVIAGAGIGGLALGCALRRAGRPFVILERASALAPVGAGITLSSNALEALDRIGLGDRVRAAGREATDAAICDRRGRVLLRLAGKTRVPIGAPTPRHVLGPTLAFARADLQAVLLADVQPFVVTGQEVSHFASSGDGITVSSVGGKSFSGDLLVGADGLRSAVRRLCRGDEPLRYAGYTCWRALLDDVDLPKPLRFTESWGPGTRFGIVPLGPRRVYWFAVADAPAGERDEADPRPALRARFAAWHAPVERLIEATPADAILRTDIYDRPPIDRWVQDRVALLGDAAHPMTPNLGQGGGQAIEDAVVLAAALVREPTLEGALAAYERQRLARANAFVTGSLRMGQIAHLRGRPLRWLRDRALGLVPTKLAERRMARQLHFEG